VLGQQIHNILILFSITMSPRPRLQSMNQSTLPLPSPLGLFLPLRGSALSQAPLPRPWTRQGLSWNICQPPVPAPCPYAACLPSHAALSRLPEVPSLASRPVAGGAVWDHRACSVGWWLLLLVPERLRLSCQWLRPLTWGRSSLCW
jgi:hypothetical protein